MALLVSLSALWLFTGTFFLYLVLMSRKPEHRVTTTAELTKVTGYKNVVCKDGRIIKNQAGYTYSYTVKGKRYTLKGFQNTHPRSVRRRVTVVYLRGFPRLAYLENYSGAIEQLMAGCCIVIGLACLALLSLNG